MTEPRVEFAREAEWLLVRCAGTTTAAWFAELFGALAQRVRSEQPAAVLIDGRELFFTPTTVERYRLGEASLQLLKGPPVALVGSERLVDPERFGELVARNRGLDGRVFTSIDEARQWLQMRVAAREGGATNG